MSNHRPSTVHPIQEGNPVETSPPYLSMTSLDLLNGEVLPERAVMSLISIDIGGAPAVEQPPPQDLVVSDGNGSTVYYACQTTHTAGSQGLVGLVGLGQPPTTTTMCTPAAIASS